MAKAGPPRHKARPSATPKKGRHVDPLLKWNGESEEMKDLKKSMASIKKGERHSKDIEMVSSVAFDRLQEITSRPKEVYKEVLKLQKLLASPALDSKTKADVKSLLADAEKAFKDLSRQASISAKTEGASYLAQRELLSRLAFVRSILAKNKQLDQATRDHLKATEQTLAELAAQTLGIEDDLGRIEDLGKSLSNIDDSINSLDKDISKEFKENQKALDKSMKFHFEKMEKWSAKHQETRGKRKEAVSFLKQHEQKKQELIEGIGDKIGIGRFNLGNAYRGYKFATNKKYRREALKDTIYGKAKSFIQHSKDVKKARETLRTREEGRPSTALDMLTRSKDTGVSAQPVVTQPLIDQVLPSVADREQQPKKNLLGRLTQTALGKGQAANDETAEKLSIIVAEGVQDSKKFHKQALKLLGRKAANDDSSSAMGGIKEGIGKIGEAITNFTGKVGPFLAAAVPFLAVAGAAYAGWKLGSALYEKYSLQILEVLDEVTGKNRQANKDAAEKRAADAASAPQDVSKAATMAATGNMRKRGLHGTQGFAASVATNATAVPSILPTSETAVPAAKAGTRTTVPTGVKAGPASTGSTPPKSEPTTTPVVTPPPIGTGTSRTEGPISTGDTSKNVGGAAVSSMMGKTMTASGDVDVQGLHPGVQKNLAGMASDYKEQTGKKLIINSAYRSQEEQANLYRTLPEGRAARPGRSMHNYGMAVDISSSQGNELEQSGLLSKYGFARPIKSKEPWHLQPAGVSLAAAKAGVFSADAPEDQGQKPQTRVAAIPAPQSFDVPEKLTDTVQGPGGEGSGGGNNRTAGANTKVGVNDIPTFETSDGLLLALNLGVA
jgi:hypothetical protein